MTDEKNQDPAPLVRDLLLASSGELPWWKRPGLARRVRRDPEALALWATLDELSGLNPTRAPSSSATSWALRPALATLLVLFAFGVGWTLLRRNTPPLPAPSAPANEVAQVVPEALHVATERLLLASTELDALPFWSEDAGALESPWASVPLTEPLFEAYEGGPR